MRARHVSRSGARIRRLLASAPAHARYVNMIKLKRVYESASKEDGRRFLIDRVWPRGLSKDELQMDGWLKEVAPSTELRKWFGHDTHRGDECQRRYPRELAAHRDGL